MSDEFISLGVRYLDWAYENILLAPDVPPGLPGVESPLTKKCYKYRIVDLESAVRTNMDPERLHFFAEEKIELMVEHDIEWYPVRL